MESESSQSPETLAILVVGTDTLIDALPARPIQLANACGALGFDLVLPLSWGDELVAEAALESLQSRGPVPALMCTCPIVRDRLLQAGHELARAMVSLVPPPVAIARHLRSTLGGRLRSLSYVGRCPGAVDPEYDFTYDPQELFAMFRDRGLDPQGQPDFFVDRLPPDRRRFVSLPGGCPAPDVLWQRCNERTLVEVDGSDLSVEIAQNLLAPQSLLIDAAPAVGCACSGVTHSTAGISVRVAVTSLEPPRSTTPVYSNTIGENLVLSAPQPEEGAGPSSSHGRRPPMAVTPPGALKMKMGRER
jgi:hypothetical protein